MYLPANVLDGTITPRNITSATKQPKWIELHFRQDPARVTDNARDSRRCEECGRSIWEIERLQLPPSTTCRVLTLHRADDTQQDPYDRQSYARPFLNLRLRHREDWERMPTTSTQIDVEVPVVPPAEGGTGIEDVQYLLHARDRVSEDFYQAFTDDDAQQDPSAKPQTRTVKVQVERSGKFSAVCFTSVADYPGLRAPRLRSLARPTPPELSPGSRKSVSVQSILCRMGRLSSSEYLYIRRGRFVAIRSNTRRFDYGYVGQRLCGNGNGTTYAHTHNRRHA